MNPKEKARALEYNESGNLPLADEELDNVAGGMDDFYIDDQPSRCKTCGSTDLKWGREEKNFDYIYLCKECGFKDGPYAPIDP